MEQTQQEMDAQHNNQGQSDYIKISNKEALWLYILLIVLVIIIGVLICGLVIYIIAISKTIYFNNPLLIRYSLGFANIIWAMKMNSSVYKKLDNYLFLDWFLIRNLFYFLLTILSVTGTVFYLVQLMLL